MNKKKVLLRNLLLCFLFLVVYISICLTFFLLAKEGERKSVSAIANNIAERLKDGSTIDEFFSAFHDSKEIHLSLYDGGKSAPGMDNLGFFEENPDYLVEVHHPGSFIGHERWLGSEACIVYVNLYGSSYLRVAKSVGTIYGVSKGMLLYGSLSFLVAAIVIYVLLYLDFKKSLKPLKLQVSKLQDITQKNRTIEYEDDLNYLTAIIRESRHQLRKELEINRISDQKINFIMDSFSEGLVVIDSNYKVVLINKKALSIFDHDKEDVQNRYLENLSAPHTLEVNFSMVIHTNVSISFVEKIQGRVYHCDINPIDYSWTRGTTNEKNGASLILIDITDEYNSTEMKKEFFANASHELKSPLTSILGYLQLIQNGTITDTSFAIGKCVFDCKRMTKIISDMLTIAAIEKESLRPIEEIDVSKAIDTILSSLLPQCKEKNIQIETDYEPMIIKMNAEDFDRIARNLLDNAVKYNRQNGKIHVSVKKEERLLVVADTGIGISKENQPRVFERFFRVDKARSRKNGDTGLGLAIVKHICNYYDCSITLESELDVGSTFIVHFPK